MIARALIALALLSAAPAAAQHAGHDEAPAASGCTPEHAAMGHCTMPEKPPAQEPKTRQEVTAPESSGCTPEHAAMGHCTMPKADGDPHAAHRAAPAGEGPQPAPPPPEALSGPAHAGDAIFGADMARARGKMVREHGGLHAYLFQVERAETVIRDGRDGFVVDAQAWVGGDIDKLWLKGELEGEWGRGLDHSEVQALWSHAIDPWFDVQAGVRVDAQPGPNRGHLVLGLQGLAPHWWEVDAALFLSNKGELTARGEAEYDLRITNDLILQPRVEVDLSAQTIEALGIGAGLSTASAGLRLRFQPTPTFAPYVGVEYERAFGKTARLRREEGEDAGSLNLLAGLRFFF